MKDIIKKEWIGKRKICIYLLWNITTINSVGYSF